MFEDPNHSRTACIKLHNLRMSLSMSADEYTSQFEILAGRTNFNEAALEDVYSRELSAAILDKIYAQLTLPVDLKSWRQHVKLISIIGDEAGIANPYL